MTFYHIDRDKTLKTGTVMPHVITNYSISKIFSDVYEHYLFHNEQDTRSVLCEWILEYVRVTLFPKMPSRFKCLFATKSRDEAIVWAQYWNRQDYNLVEIEADTYIELDCSWFTDSRKICIPNDSPYLLPTSVDLSSTAILFEKAVKYWSGQRSDIPRLEVLIPYPCQVKNIYRPND